MGVRYLEGSDEYIYTSKRIIFLSSASWVAQKSHLFMCVHRRKIFLRIKQNCQTQVECNDQSRGGPTAVSLEEGQGAPTCHWLAPLHLMVGHRSVAPQISLLWPLAAKRQDNNGKVQFFPVLTKIHQLPSPGISKTAFWTHSLKMLKKTDCF